MDKTKKLEKGKTYQVDYQPSSQREGRPFKGPAKYTGTKKKLGNGTTVYEFQGANTIGFFPREAVKKCKKS